MLAPLVVSAVPLSSDLADSIGKRCRLTQLEPGGLPTAPGELLAQTNGLLVNSRVDDLVGEQDLHEGHRLWPHVQSWAAELGLTAPDAIERATQPPRDINTHQERAIGQPDLEAAD
jgi:hypothetical protein